MEEKKKRKAHSYSEMSYLALHQPDTFQKVDEKDKQRFPPRGRKKQKDGEKTASALSFFEKFADARTNFFVVEHDPEADTYLGEHTNNKATKSAASYRRGEGQQSCRHCVHYDMGSCAKVEGSISQEARCRFIETKDSLEKEAGMRRMHQKTQHPFAVYGPSVAQERLPMGLFHSMKLMEKQAQNANQSVGANLATMLDGEVEENKMLREEVARLRGNMEASGGDGQLAIPDPPPPGSMPSPAEQNAQAAAMAGQGQPAPGGPPMNTGPNPGMGGMDPTGQMPPGQGPAPMTGEPTPGQPPGGIIDPNTGMPAPIDPTTGMPMVTDPMTGQMMPMDPQTGQMIDPATGQPMPPPPSEAEQQLQLALQQTQMELEKLDKENKRLEDENRALHHAIDPDEMSDRAKRIYDRAGTLPGGKQEIPLEGSPRKQLDRDMMRMLLGQSVDEIAAFGPTPPQS